MQIKVMAFEEFYSDDSGVQYAVRYDSKKVGDEIEFECVNDVRFPVSKLDWLIGALSRIRQEIDDGA